MADHFLANALGCARRVLAQPADPAADSYLLERFVRDQDQHAFAELVARHGPVVWTACRRGAVTAADAEDAFQATFLVLARRAGHVRRAAAVSGWLFRVAVRLTARTRARAARPDGPGRPAADPSPDPADRAAWQDLVAVLDSELAALPETVRAALVCCYYEGLTQDEAAQRLGWKVRTVRARVARGRTILRARLARRGVDLGATLTAATVGAEAGGAVPPVGLAVHGPVVGSPTVAALVQDGLALTSHAAALRLAVAAAVVVVAGIGYAFVASQGTTDPTPVVAAPTESPVPQAHPKSLVDPVAVYNRAIDGCVYVVSESNGRTIEGTGVLIDGEKRLILTTYRTVGDSDVVSVQFPYHNLDGTIETDRKEYARSAAARLSPMGRVIHRDKTRDLALVQLDRLSRNARSLEMAEADIGETALHIGSGTGLLFPMAVRKVIAPPTELGEQAKPRTIMLSGFTDDSGAPLVDRDGKLVGLVKGATTDPKDGNTVLAVGVSEIRAFLADKDKPVPAVPALPTPKDPTPPIITPSEPFWPSLHSIPGDIDTVALYKKVVDTAVFIVTPMKGGMAMGSGSLIDAEKRYVLTSYSVVEEEPFVFCQFPVYLKDGALMTDKKKYIERIPAGQASKGTVLYRDKTRDLAIVQLDKLPTTAKQITLAKKSTSVGETTFNIGSPGAANQVFSFADGKVRALGVEDLISGGSEAPHIKCKIVTTTNPIRSGDSGGPIVNSLGHLVAVAAIASNSGSISRSIDVTEVWAFLREKTIIIANVPADPKDLALPKMKENEPKAGRPPTEGGPAAPLPNEKAAAQLLQRAKLFAEGEDNLPLYKAKLKDVIAKYPGTNAAKEAKKVLDAMK